MEPTLKNDTAPKRVIAFGGLVGALLASTCCIAPLILLTAGVSGAWIGNLTALAPYQGYFTGATLLLLASGFWFVYWKPRKACETGTYCATPQADRVIKTLLWVSTVLIGVALTDDWWAPLFA
jgi:mercuric ion transport protein